MTPFLALVLPVTTEGPLGRVELAAERPAGDVHLAAEAALVDDLAARLRADARVANGGLRVDAGCSSTRCTVALDGLASSLPEGLAALDAAMSAPLPPLTYARRRALRRDWRTAWRAPLRVFDAALHAVAHDGQPPPAAEKPAFPLFRGPPRPVDGPLRWTELVAAGDVAAPGPAWDTLVAHRTAALAALPPPGDVPPPPPAPPDRAPVLLVDAPGETRATVGLVWATTPDDAVRDTLAAGDFESVLVQRLRERDTFTYDVTPEAGAGWAGASFQVAVEAVPAALAAARAELAQLPQLGAAPVAGATRRLQARYAELADTLPGRLALRRLPPAPAAPPATLRPVALTGVVVLGPGDPLRPLLRGEPLTETDPCSLVYAGPCPR